MKGFGNAQEYKQQKALREISRKLVDFSPCRKIREVAQVLEMVTEVQTVTAGVVTGEQTVLAEAELPSTYGRRKEGSKESKRQMSWVCPVLFFTGSLQPISWAAAARKALGTDCRTQKLEIT